MLKGLKKQKDLKLLIFVKNVETFTRGHFFFNCSIVMCYTIPGEIVHSPLLVTSSVNINSSPG